MAKIYSINQVYTNPCRSFSTGTTYHKNGSGSIDPLHATPGFWLINK